MKICYWDSEACEQRERDATPEELAQAEVDALAVARPRVPHEIPMWAAKEVLIEEEGSNGGSLLDDVFEVFNGIGDEKERRKALSKLDSATVVRRDDPWVNYVIPLLGKSEAEIDALFIAAGALDA